ncbi:MAG: hypothetical protein JXQ90_16430 [Cyclobacteriaceae bacterium]
MNSIEETSPMYFAVAALISGTIFCVLWLLDSIIHGKIVDDEITGSELQTHRNILAASLLMEIALVAMYWFPIEALPFFIAFFLTRTAHEFIDELHWHANRCSQYESMLHLGMWVSILSQTAILFMWGFFSSYNGILALPVYMYVWGAILFLIMSYTSIIEWNRSSSKS